MRCSRSGQRPRRSQCFHACSICSTPLSVTDRPIPQYGLSGFRHDKTVTHRRRPRGGGQGVISSNRPSPAVTPPPRPGLCFQNVSKTEHPAHSADTRPREKALFTGPFPMGAAGIAVLESDQDEHTVRSPRSRACEWRRVRRESRPPAWRRSESAAQLETSSRIRRSCLRSRRVGQEYPNLDNVFERCARRMQDRLTVGERLTCLFLNRRADEGSGRHIDAD